MSNQLIRLGTGAAERYSRDMQARPRIVTETDASTVRRRRVAVWALALASCAVGALGAWALLSPERGRFDPPRQNRELAAAQEQIQRLEQRIAILERGGQVTELANRELRSELVEMQGELARLTDEVGFYQRLLGAGGSGRGLAVHALKLEPTSSARVFRFELTLSQNLKKAEQIAGRLELAVEGVRADRAAVLDWAGLAVRMDSERNDFAFRYFQQLNGSFQLPPDFQPQRVIVSLYPNDKTPQVAESFSWAELIEESKDV